MTKEELIKEIEYYLNDFDNLNDCGFMKNTSPIKDYVFSRHKDLDLNDFINKGREFIRLYLMELKNNK